MDAALVSTPVAALSPGRRHVGDCIEPLMAYFESGGRKIVVQPSFTMILRDAIARARQGAATGWLVVRWRKDSPGARLLLLLLVLTLTTAVQAQFDYVTNNGTITLTKYTGSGGA